jgi:subtilase family serine protease
MIEGGRSDVRLRHVAVALAAVMAVSGASIGAVSFGEPAGAATSNPAGAATSNTVVDRVGTLPFVPKGAIELGPLARSVMLSVDIVLQPRDPASLAAYATAVSTPGSSLYRHYLPAGAFPAVFGPHTATIRSVEKWLRERGLRPPAISGDHLYFQVTASAADLERAFSVGLVRYDVGGHIAYANTAAPLFATSVAGAIQGVVGLSNLALPRHESMLPIKDVVRPHVVPHVFTGGPQPCGAATTEGVDSGSYTADQLASAYDFSALYGAGDEGSGETVALFELEPDLSSDISAYQSCYGTDATVTYTKVDGGAGSGAGGGEAALDIEDVIGLAPQATIDVYQAPNSDTGLYEDYSEIVSQDVAKVVSTSWGVCEKEAGSTMMSEEATVFEDAAVQGQSVFAAAGDSGSEDCYFSDGSTTLAVDDPGSQPYVTDVGGTTLDEIGPPPTQTVWNTAGAGGGGISTKWAMPSYQSDAPASLNVVNSHSSATPCAAPSGTYCREVPDVSADADPYTGYVFYYEGAWTSIGGTSAAPPLWAALTALIDASSGCAGAPIGFANPSLYNVAGSTSYSASFSDITSGDNDYTGTHSGKFPAGSAYDMASGLGTPIAGGLDAALCGGSVGNIVTVTDPGKQTTAVGTKVSLQVEASDSGGLELTYASAGLPKGLKLNARTGLVTGRPTQAGKSTVTIAATDPTGAHGGTTFTWKVKS